MPKILKNGYRRKDLLIPCLRAIRGVREVFRGLQLAGRMSEFEKLMKSGGSKRATIKR